MLKIASGFAQVNGSIVKKKEQYGYRLNNKWVIKPKYDSIRPFFCNRAAVLKNRKWGFVNEKGKKAIPLDFFGANNFSGGMASVRRDTSNKWRLINSEGVVFYNNPYISITHVDSISICSTIDDPWAKVKDTVLDIWVYPGRKIYDGVEKITKRNDVYLLEYKKIYVSREQGYVATDQIIKPNGKAVTPRVYCTNEILNKPSVIFDPKTGKSAIISPKAELSPWYDKADKLSENYFLFGNGGKFGIINHLFDTVIKPVYSEISFADNCFILREDKIQYLSDNKGNRISESFYNMLYLGEGFCKAKKNAKDSTEFLINSKGKIIDEYSFLFLFNNGFARVVNAGDNTKYAYVNRSGKVITAWYTSKKTFRIKKSSWIDGFTKGLATFLTLGLVKFGDGSYSSASSTQLQYTEFREYDRSYDYFFGTDFVRGRAMAYKFPPSLKKFDKNDPLAIRPLLLKGVIDTNDRTVIPFAYSSINRWGKFFIVDKSSGIPSDVGMFDNDGKPVLETKWDEIYPISESFYSVGKTFKNALYKYDGNSGKFLTDFLYKDIWHGGDSLLRVTIDKGMEGHKWGYMDYSGNVIIQPTYYSAEKFEKGKARVRLDLNSEAFYINLKGQKIQN